MRARLRYAAFGIVATLFGMAVGHFVASLLHPDSSPVLAVGYSVIDLTPHTLKDYAIEKFGTHDKAVLVSSVFAGVIVLAAIAGLLTKRRRELGFGLIAVLVAVAGVAVVTRPAFTFLDIVPTFFTLIAGVAALWYLDRLATTAPTTKPTTHPDDVDSLPEPGTTVSTGSARSGPSRRGLLVASAAITAAAAALGGAGRVINGIRARPEDIALPTPTNDLGPLPKGVERQYSSITPLNISNSAFYKVDTRLDTPVVASDGWSLTIDGDVDHNLEISFDDLLAMPTVERDITLTCVSNAVGGKYIGGARWQGVLLNDILDMAGVGQDSDQMVGTDFDGLTIGSPLEVVRNTPDAMIAIGMNGDQLPREHGFPARIIVPGLYGFVSATKWVTRLTMTTYADTDVYWTKRKWATDAPIKPSARIDTPRSLSKVKTGQVVVGGVAWAQHDGGVGKVQVQLDGGGWTDAMLGPAVNSIYWRQWYYLWDVKDAGSHNVKARVVDGGGTVQADVRAEPFPAGSSGIHSVFVTAT